MPLLQLIPLRLLTLIILLRIRFQENLGRSRFPLRHYSVSRCWLRQYGLWRKPDTVSLVGAADDSTPAHTAVTFVTHVHVVEPLLLFFFCKNSHDLAVISNVFFFSLFPRCAVFPQLCNKTASNILLAYRKKDSRLAIPVRRKSNYMSWDLNKHFFFSQRLE